MLAIHDPPELTADEARRRRAATMQALSEFWAREQREARREKATRREAERHERRVNRPGISVWQVDEAGNVVAKYADAGDAGRAHHVHRVTIQLAVKNARCLRDGRRFIRCGSEIETFKGPSGRRVRRVSDGKVFNKVTHILPPELTGGDFYREYARLWKAVYAGREWHGERYEFVEAE